MTKSWAKEFALKGGNVRVNAVAPGYTMTNKNEKKATGSKIVITYNGAKVSRWSVRNSSTVMDTTSLGACGTVCASASLARTNAESRVIYMYLLFIRLTRKKMKYRL